MEKNNSKKGFFYGIIPQMKEFYIKELKSRHMWNFIISVFLYFAILITFATNIISIEKILNSSSVEIYEDEYSNFNENSSKEDRDLEYSVEKISRIDAVKNKAALGLITVISGMTPYIYIPAIVTVIYPLIAAVNVSTNGFLMIVLMSLLILLELFIMSLVIAVGMYWCSCSTKHFRYNQSSSFTINDVRLQFNEAMKKEENVEKIKKEMEDKYQKVKLLNVKINYKAIFIFAFISILLLCIITLITGV